MALDKRQREQMLAHCGEIHPEDGIDPNEFFKPSRQRGKSKHRSQQLFHQVAETLEFVLSGETNDEMLQSLHVVSVAPAPDASRLLVALHCDLPAEAFDRAELESRLARQSGRLRCAIAAAITRRKTPVLAFAIFGPTEIVNDSIEESAP